MTTTKTKNFNDGNLSQEKVVQLISLRLECEELDYKASLDFASQRQLLELAKDVMAMANMMGGYILIGVTDAFEPVGLPETFHIDSAELQQRLERYFSPRVDIGYGEFTVAVGLAKKKFALVYVTASPEIVVTKVDGNYTEPGKSGTQQLFAKNEVWVRRASITDKASDVDYRSMIRRMKSAGLEFIEEAIPRTPLASNIPRAEYTEFVGRKSYIDDIVKKLQGRYFVVSIDGVGGVGKTALAHQVATKCWDEHLFDAVVWISAKSRRLTLTGIDDIAPSLTSYGDLLNTIAVVLGIPESSGLPLADKERDVLKLLSSAKCLVVIDNLETVDDQSIFNFLKDLPDPSKALVTSRKRLGEVERVVRLAQMPYEEAKELIRLEADRKSAKLLLEAGENTLKALFNATGGIPLAITWVVGWISNGAPVDHILKQIQEKESPLLEFCFKEAFHNMLSDDAKTVLSLMPIFTEEPSRAQLEAASDIHGNRLDEAITQLVMFSLLNENIKQDPDGVKLAYYTILPLTLSFAQGELSLNRGLEKDGRKRLGAFLQTQARVKEAAEQYGYALEDLGATSDTGRAAALLANLAFAAYQRGSYGDSVRLFQQAVQTNRYLSYIYQLWAIVERQEGHYGRADELFQEAARLNPNNPMVWRAWASMKQEFGAYDDAKKYAEKAFQANPHDLASLNRLAVIEGKRGNHPVAKKMLLQALAKNPQTYEEKRHNIVTYGALAENYRRWGLSEEGKVMPEEARKKYEYGLACVNSGLGLDPKEWKLREIGIRLYRNLGALEFNTGNFERSEALLRKAFFRNPRDFLQEKHNSDVYVLLAKSFRELGLLDECIKVCDEGLEVWPENYGLKTVKTGVMSSKEYSRLPHRR